MKCPINYILSLLLEINTFNCNCSAVTTALRRSVLFSFGSHCKKNLDEYTLWCRVVITIRCFIVDDSTDFFDKLSEKNWGEKGIFNLYDYKKQRRSTWSGVWLWDWICSNEELRFDSHLIIKHLYWKGAGFCRWLLNFESFFFTVFMCF